MKINGECIFLKLLCNKAISYFKIIKKAKRKNTLRNLKKKITASPKNVEYLFEHGKKFFYKGDLDKARIYFEEILRLNLGKWRFFSLYWCKATELFGYVPNKIIYINEILEFFPDDPEISVVWLEKGKLLVEEGLYNEAIICYNMALKLDAECYESKKDISFKIWKTKGIYLRYNTHLYDEAIICFDEALKLSPNNSGIQFFKEGALECKNSLNKEEI